MTRQRQYQFAKNIEHLTEEKRRLLDLSAQEVDGLSTRLIHCPLCHFPIDRVYEDTTGHKDAKCRKCKFEGPINLAYFRRSKYLAARRREYYAVAEASKKD